MCRAGIRFALLVVVASACGTEPTAPHQDSTVTSIAADVETSASVGTAASAAPETHEFVFDQTPFLLGLLSRWCGIPVYIGGQQRIVVRLFTDRQGQIVAELDNVDFSIFYTSPIDEGGTGAIVEVPTLNRQNIRFVYPEGATLGAPALLYITGTGVNFWPGVLGDPLPGQAVLVGEVVDIWNGVPIVGMTDIAIEHHGPDGIRSTLPGEAICEALGGPLTAASE